MIKYKEGYKYQLAETYQVYVGLRPERDVLTEYILLSTKGFLSIMEGYAWDGPSGPAIDTKNFMRGSLIHDALYQLIREGKLAKTFRAAADIALREACLEDGMCSIRAWYVYQGVRNFGGPFAVTPDETLTAP